MNIDINMNRLHNTKNRNQGEFPKTLCVCSGGLLRSPTISFVLSNSPFNHNTRAVGTSGEYSLIHIDLVTVEWADEIVCANEDHLHTVSALVKECSNPAKKIHCLNLPDRFQMRDPKLIELVTQKLKEIYGKENNSRTI